MPFGFPTAVAGGALSAEGIEIPKGHPGQIRDAAAALKVTASKLRDCASAVTGAGMDALAAEGWSGGAASAFFSVAGELSNTIDQGAEPLLRGAANTLKAAGKGLKKISDRIPEGPVKGIFARHPRDRIPPAPREPLPKVTIITGTNSRTGKPEIRKIVTVSGNKRVEIIARGTRVVNKVVTDAPKWLPPDITHLPPGF